MAESHPRLPGHQPFRSRGFGRPGIDPQVPGRVPDQRGLPGRVGRRQQQQRLRAAGQGPHPGPVQLLQTAPESQRPVQRLRTRQLGGGQLRGQLDQRQRVTRRIGHDAPAHLAVNRRTRRPRQQLLRRLFRQPADRQLRQSGQDQRLSLSLAGGEHHAHPVRIQAPGDEPEHLDRYLVQPLRVIDQAQHRARGRRVGQHRQSRQADQEPVWRRACHQPERRLEGLLLRYGKTVETGQERDKQLVQAGETHVHLGLCAGYPGYLHVAGLFGRPVQQRRLSYARLAPQHQHPAQPVPDRRLHVLQRAGLHRPVQQRANRSALLRWWHHCRARPPGSPQ